LLSLEITPLMLIQKPADLFQSLHAFRTDLTTGRF